MYDNKCMYIYIYIYIGNKNEDRGFLSNTFPKPYLKHIKSFIGVILEIAWTFLFKCPREVDSDTEIVTFYVTSLYTSIPHEFGLKA